MTVRELLAKIEPGKIGATFTPAITVQSLEERGRSLPMGLLSGGTIVRDFSFLPDTSELDITLGGIENAPEFRNRECSLLPAKLGESLDLLCATDLHADKMRAESRRLAVSALCHADVVYLTLWRAMERGAFADAIPAPRGTCCPSCGKLITTLRMDLMKARVAVWDWTPAAPPRVVVGLHTPFRLSDAMPETRHLVLGPPAWSRSLLPLTDVEYRNQAIRDLAFISASVVGGDDGKEGGLLSVQSWQAFRGLTSKDRKALASGAAMVGADMSPLPVVPVPCPSCGETASYPLGWGDLGFTHGSSGV